MFTYFYLRLLTVGVFLDSPTGFTVDAKSIAPKGEGKVRAIVTSPSGQRTESLVKNNNDGTYDVLYTPYEQGRAVYVKWEMYD